jgi:hypothetical protein
MNRLIMPILFVICCVYYSCTNDDCTVLLVERQPIDPCENRHIVACSFEFRKGKWLQIQDSTDSSIADTIWFKQDSLIGWSFQGNPYLDLEGYFINDYLYTESWSSSGPAIVDFYTTYNDTSKHFTIHTAAGLRPVDFVKID